MLSYGELNFKKKYFKFESWWLRVEGFKEKVQQWWGAFVVNGRPNYILAEKLKMLKERLKEWSRNNRGNWKQRKGDILNQLATLEAIQEQRALTDDEAMQKSNLALEFEEYADDTVIFCEPKVEQIGYIRMILTIFEAFSGLKVNWGKTSLFLIKEVPNIQNLAIIL
ncbi:hypothetical protein H5410_016309, partial [Solanum commersonii]